MWYCPLTFSFLFFALHQKLHHPTGSSQKITIKTMTSVRGKHITFLLACLNLSLCCVHAVAEVRRINQSINQSWLSLLKNINIVNTRPPIILTSQTGHSPFRRTLQGGNDDNHDHNRDSTFDYIIVGAGNAGAVVAAR